MIYFLFHIKMFLHYLSKHENTQIAFFHSNIVITAFPESNQSLFNFFSVVDLQLTFTAVDSLNFVINNSAVACWDHSLG